MDTETKVVNGSPPPFPYLLLPLFLFSLLLLYTFPSAITAQFHSSISPNRNLIISFPMLSNSQLFLISKIQPFPPPHSKNPILPRKRRTISCKCRSVADFSRSGAGLWFSRPIRRRSKTSFTLQNSQVWLSTLIMVKISISCLDLSPSLSIPLISKLLISGGYLYPCYLMNVRHNSSFYTTYLLWSMAINNVEDELLFRESDFLELEDDQSTDLNQALNLTLAGKLLAINRPSLSNMTFYASRSWDCPNRLSVFDHGKGLYTFQFVLDSDVLRVITGGPWFIEGKLLLVQRINPNLAINNMPFDTTKIWVRCFDLPPKAFNSKFAKAIGNMLGCYCDSDLQEAGADNPMISRLPSVRKYLRIKVSINLSFPLKRSQVIRIRNIAENKFEEFLVKLAYERLPALFCYRCGLLGHDLEKCSSEGPILYGDWIRSEKYYRIKPNGSENIPSQSEPSNEQNIQPQPQPTNTSGSPNPITLDPNIVLANFKEIRALGPLPTVPLLKNTPQNESSLNDPVPLVGSSSINPPHQSLGAIQEALRTSQTKAITDTNQTSILGAIPLTKASTLVKPPLSHPKSIHPSYFNALIPSSDLFSPNTQRCLFKSDLIHPAFSTQPKAAAVSPPELSPIGSLSSNQTTTVSESAFDKSIVNSKGKRPIAASSSKGVETSKPKRGRPPSGSTKNA